MRFLGSLAAGLSLVTYGLAIGQNATLTFTAGTNQLHLAGDGKSPTILLDSQDFSGIIRTARDVATDFGRVTSHNGTVHLTNSTTVYQSEHMIIAGSITNSSIIKDLIKSGKLDVGTTRGHWEAFTSQLVKDPLPGIAQALVIAGADQRGTIYGLYDISEQIGVSPWYWWADVAPKMKQNVYAMNVTKNQQSPSIKWRGIFLNDEQPALTNWVQANFPNGKYGPGFNADFHSRIFELLLRLRANYIWTTTWNSMFSVDDPNNDSNAQYYGFVVGSSHTEPMMRWTKEQSLFLDGIWSWQMNRENVTKFMKEGAERAAPYEHVWTLGMRGLGDTASPTLNASQLEDIISVQQNLLRGALNKTDLSGVPQMWCLYKEVGSYFAQGLEVPEEITLLWAEDNWGNAQRLPIASETNRSGGSGVYYHFDYVGDPMNYKWIDTISLQKTWEQMHLAYERQARNIWIVNVGDMKGLEVPISHWFDLAYDVPSMSSPDSTETWLQAWATREFGTTYANEIADIRSNYSRLVTRRKYEMITPQTYSLMNYNEAENVLGEWKSIVDSAYSIYNKLSVADQPSFFQLVLHPAAAGYVVNQVHINAGRNNMYAVEWRTSANNVAQKVLELFKQDHTLQQQYHSLLNGKWNHFMDQTHYGYNWFQQPMRNILPPLQYTQSLEVAADGSMGVTAESHNGSAPGDSLYNPANSNSVQIPPPIDPYGPQTRYIDIYSIGVQDFTYSVKPNVTWIKATPSSGKISGAASGGNDSDVRVHLSVDWTKAPAGSSTVFINITSDKDYGSFQAPKIMLNVNNTKAPSDFHGFVESDGHISIEAEHASSNTSTNDASYAIIPGYGRTLSGVILWPVTALSQTDGPKLSYNFYTFSSQPKANITVYVGPSLNTDPSRPLKYALALDGSTPTTIQPVANYTLGSLPASWSAGVSNGINTNTTMFNITAGTHTLDLWLLEPGLVLEKLVVDMGGVRPSYLGPPESRRI